MKYLWTGIATYYSEIGYKLAFYNSVIEILKRVQDDKECELVDFISITYNSL